ncbi:hypothetical protein HA402_009496 [Bradysia odoriphaga]|nr:hypothetical protein HA402_009496 [Bradysia odoriphaga]
MVEVTAKNAIIQNSEDRVTVVFYNTQFSPSPRKATDVHSMLVAPAHTAIFMHPTVISSEDISIIKSFKESKDLFDFKNRFGSTDAENLVEALWLCSRIVMTCKRKLKHDIIVITNNDEPYPVQSAEVDKCQERKNDLRDLDVIIEIVPMVDDEFDVNLFWMEFICSVNDYDVEMYEFPSPRDKRARLNQRIFHKQHKSCCISYFDWIIGKDLKISCGLFGFAKTFKAKKVLLFDGKKVVSRTTHVIETTDEKTNTTTLKRLLPGDQRKVLEVGGQKIILTPVEVTKLKSFGMPGMKLLGFKPMSRLPLNGDVKHYRMMYPDETHIKGSKQLFRALWQKCIEKGKFAICVFADNRGLNQSYVALVPQQRESFQNDGFRILYLATQDDFSMIPLGNEAPEVPDKHQNLMKKIVKSLKFEYNACLFADPFQKKFHAILEAFASGEEVNAVDVSTELVPDVDEQDKKIQAFVDEFIGPVVQDDVDSNSVEAERSTSSEPDELRNAIVNAITSNNVNRLPLHSSLNENKW